jgi:Rps23 Pro-64 3,4-dihydroxylase Tpa1-like proline 4-hydroxylase
MLKQLVNLISEKLMLKKDNMKMLFESSIEQVGVRFCSIDELLPKHLADQISESFPHYSELRHLNSFKENKYTSKSFDKYNPILKNMTFAIQDESVIQIINNITGISDQVADPTLYAGGLSMMPRNSFLNPHIDNSHNGDRSHYRTVNLLYYITPDWKIENGGNLELWNTKVKKSVTIESKFNRLVLMETNPWSWHSVSKVVVDKSRNCISNYYFSKKSPLNYDYFHVTSFSERPEEKWKSPIFFFDNKIRQSVRYIFPNGLGSKDVYQNFDSKE